MSASGPLVFFSECSHVAYSTKLTAMKQRTQCKQIFCPIIHQLCLKGQNNFFSEEGHVAYQKERSEEHYASKMLDLMHTPDLFGWVKSSDIEIVQTSIHCILIELSELIGFGWVMI